MFKVNELIKASKGKLISGDGKGLIRGISIDSRTIKNGEAFIAIKGGNFDGHDFIDDAIKGSASCIIVNKGFIKNSNFKSLNIIEVSGTIKAMANIANYQRRKFNIPVIAVTGSTGKTTTKEMIYAVLSKKYKVLKNEGTKNNNIGLPLTLFKLNNEFDIAVLELGTNHPGEISELSQICEPNVGVITNIGEAHLEYFRNLRGVLKEKHSLISGLGAPGLAVLNFDDDMLRKKFIGSSKRNLVLGFSIDAKSDFQAFDLRLDGWGISFGVNNKNEIKLNNPARHNVYNALAAISVGRVFGLEYGQIISALRDFEFPQGRLNLMIFKKTKFIDDTYNSNPLSLRNALDALGALSVKGRKILVMGDMLELGDESENYHSEAGKSAAGICDVFITVGKLSKKAADAAITNSLDRDCVFSCNSSREANKILFNKIIPDENDIVLVKGSRMMKMEEVFKDAL